MAPKDGDVQGDFRNAVVENHCVPGELVEMRGGIVLVPIATEMIGPQGINRKHHDIGGAQTRRHQKTNHFEESLTLRRGRFRETRRCRPTRAGTR